MKNYLLLTLTVALTLASCKKDDSPSSKSKSNTEKITAHSWVLSSSVIDPKVDFGNGPTSDGRMLMIECDWDNQFIYETSGNYVGDEGADKCDPFSSQTSVLGTWAFTNDEKTLTLDTKAFGIDNLELVSLSENELVVKGIKSVGGNPITYVNTYIAP